MKKIAEFGRVEIYHIETSKFKTGSINITFIDQLKKERVYKNALLPSLLSRGCEMCPSAREISLKMQKLYGASFDTNVEKKGEVQLVSFVADYVDDKYANNCKGLFSQLVDVIFSIITNPVTEKDSDGTIGFKKEFFEQEKVNQDNFIKGLINDKQSYAYEKCLKIMCADEAYGLYEIGSISDGENLTAQNLYDYYINYFLKEIPIRIYVCSSSYPEELCEAVQKIPYFKGENKKKFSTGFVYKYPQKIRFDEECLDVKQGKLTIGFRTNVKPTDEEYYALAVSNGIFGAGLHSKLFQNVREKNSLAYYAASRLEKYKGLLIAYSGIEICNYKKTYELILEQMEDIKKGNITETEFNSTIKMYENSYNACKDTQFAMMDYYIGLSLIGLSYDLDETIEKIKKVDMDDVVRVSQNICPDTISFIRDCTKG